MKLNKEVWKDIPELSGYQASNLGNVRSLNYRKKGIIKELSQYYSNGGYLAVKITRNGIGRKYLVHILVMWAFNGKNNKREINHKDGNKKNNNIENLEYCTRSENILHAYKTGLKKAPSGEKHVKTRPILQLKNNEIIRKYNFIKEAEKYGFNHSKIILCCQGKRSTHKDYQWRYADE